MGKRFSQHKASPARDAARMVGTRVRLRRAFTQEVIAQVLAPSTLSSEDRAFATRLALGVTSTQGTLDEIINRFLHDPASVQDEVRDALRVSTYEIIFLDKTSHAAVDQGVELVRSVAPKATGLANAVLRKVVAARADFPFGDPVVDHEACARQHAFPLWLAELLIADLGYEAACRFMEASNEQAPLFLAVNACKMTDAEFQEQAQKAGIKVGKVALAGTEIPGCFRLFNAQDLRSEFLQTSFKQGKILVSDAASQMVALKALPDAYPDSFLEIGAGRGTKSILLQSNAVRRWGKQMPLQILDTHAFKVELTQKRAHSYGVHIENALVQDARFLTQAVKPASLAAVFIDTPCSGLGTLRRHPEIRWRLTPQDIVSMSALDRALLEEAALCVRAGGILTYATCTVTKAENSEVVRAFLGSAQGSRFCIPSKSSLFASLLVPGSSDAHFAVRMESKS